MVASTAQAARSGWSVWPGIPWSICPEWGGQFAAESGVKRFMMSRPGFTCRF